MRRRTLLVLALLAYCLPLSAPAQETKTVKLFNGKDLAGWDYFLTDDAAKMQDVWSVEDGILICKGDPKGFLATKEAVYELQADRRLALGGRRQGAG